MKIGEVATQAGVRIDTLRYYERRGLLHEPKRRPSGYREYAPESVRLIKFIKGAQELGFTLDEVEELLRLRDDRQASCADVRAAASLKIQDVDRKLRNLRGIKRALGVLIKSCRGSGGTRECPILDAIADVAPSTRIP